MALVPAPAPGGKLAQWGLTRESSLDEYWEQAAVHCYSRSEKMQAAARQMPDAFFDLFGTSTVDMMLALTEGQVEKALEAGGLSPNHIQALEYSCGHKFRSLHGAPDSASIVKTVPISKESKHDTTSKFDSRKEPSLGWLLTQRGYSTEKLPLLPASVLLAAEDTEDPSTTCALPAAPASTLHAAPHSLCHAHPTAPMPHCAGAPRPGPARPASYDSPHELSPSHPSVTAQRDFAQRCKACGRRDKEVDPLRLQEGQLRQARQRADCRIADRGLPLDPRTQWRSEVMVHQAGQRWQQLPQPRGECHHSHTLASRALSRCHRNGTL